MADRIKVAVLGGGVGAMTAAYYLTNPQPDGPAYDVTVYQLGWRIGGKGASGRNAAIGQRIEEHGLHIWMGFYANAFRIMREAYPAMNRPPGAPLATWEEAYKPHNVITLMDQWKGEWSPWIFEFPQRQGLPGDQTSFPTPCDYIPHIPHRIADEIEEFLANGHTCSAEHPQAAVHREHLGTIVTALRKAGDQAKADLAAAHHDHVVLRDLMRIAQKLIGLGLDLFDDCADLRRLLLIADMGVAIDLGIIVSNLCENGWESIDDQEWRQWLIANGMHKENHWGSLVRAVYDLAFGYRDGIADPDHADMVAGTTTCGCLRMALNYEGSIFFKMQAGMGDTVFTPFYEVLKQRGVKFEFFHRVREVVPSADGSKIERVRIGVQATLKDGIDEYQPLVDVNDLGCWPSEPLYDQLVQGDELKRFRIDLESYDAPWPDVRELELVSGDDFDYVVFGLAAGAVPYVCPQLVAQKQNWADMVANVKTVRTQAFQLWLDKDVQELGWLPALDGRDGGERAVLGTYVEPLDTWADMSQLLPRESWSVDVKNVSYFCGVLADDADPSSVPEHAHNFLENDIQTLWTRSCPDGTFDYQSLCIDNPRGSYTDRERFDAQYFRANTMPTERYVLSVAGSTKFRIVPDDTGYANLLIAGDWVRNGFGLGCVESAVLGGMKAVRKLVPGMVIVE